MKRGVALAWFVIGVGAVVLPAAGWPSVVEPYLRIHAALAGDALDGVKAAAVELAAAADQLGKPGAEVAGLARTLADASAIEEARKAFGRLSDALIKAAGDEAGAGVRVAYCPMARGHWLQKGDEIRNPYYGAQMLRCGEFKK